MYDILDKHYYAIICVIMFIKYMYLVHLKIHRSNKSVRMLSVIVCYCA